MGRHEIPPPFRKNTQRDESAVNYCFFREKMAYLMIYAINYQSVQRIMHLLRVIFACHVSCGARIFTRTRCHRHSAHAQTEQILGYSAGFARYPGAQSPKWGCAKNYARECTAGVKSSDIFDQLACHQTHA